MNRRTLLWAAGAALVGALWARRRSRADRAACPTSAPTYTGDLGALQDQLTAAGVCHFNAHQLTWSQTAGSNVVPPAGTYRNSLVRAAQLADRLRNAVGHQLLVSSGYRTPELNQEVGGSSDSAHLRGAALDVNLPKSMQTSAHQEQLRQAAARAWVADPSFHGLGMYSEPLGRLHIDVDHPGSNGKRIWPEQRVQPYIDAVS